MCLSPSCEGRVPSGFPPVAFRLLPGDGRDGRWCSPWPRVGISSGFQETNDWNCFFFFLFCQLFLESCDAVFLRFYMSHELRAALEAGVLLLVVHSRARNRHKLSNFIQLYFPQTNKLRRVGRAGMMGWFLRSPAQRRLVLSHSNLCCFRVSLIGLH